MLNTLIMAGSVLLIHSSYWVQSLQQLFADHHQDLAACSKCNECALLEQGLEGHCISMTREHDGWQGTPSSHTQNPYKSVQGGSLASLLLGVVHHHCKEQAVDVLGTVFPWALCGTSKMALVMMSQTSSSFPPSCPCSVRDDASLCRG